MKYLTPDRIFYFKRAYARLKRYKKYVFVIIVFSLAASVFEGFSLGAVVPFLQSLMNNSETFAFPIFKGAQKALTQGPQNEVILKLLVFVFSMVILKSASNFVRLVMIARTNSIIRRDLQNNLFNAVIRSSQAYYTKMKSGELIATIHTHSKGIVNFYFVLLDMVMRLGKLVVYGILLFALSWKFTLLIAVLMLILSYPIKQIFAKIKNLSMQTTKKISELHTQLVELFSAIRLVKIFSREKNELEKVGSITGATARLEYQTAFNSNILGPLAEISVMLGGIILFVVAIKGLKIDLFLQLPIIIAYLYIFLRVFDQSRMFIQSISRLFISVEPYKEYEKILKKATISYIPSGTKAINSFNSEIIFDHVSVEYESKQKVLSNISLTIEKGSFVAVVGPTGSGKTTMAYLLAGLIYPTSGGILVDGIELREIDPKYWHRIIGYITQDLTLLNDTIKENIVYGTPAASQSDIIQAAKRANIHDFISKLPEGYETVVGEKGTRLSGGQKQRIAIAQVIIHDPQILILDEATSALDAETEKLIQSSIEKIMKNKTVIAVTHQLSTIERADMIYVVDQGKIVETGIHEELIKQGGLYKKYYEIQFKL